MIRLTTHPDIKYVKLLAGLTSVVVLILIIVNIVISAQVSYWGYQLSQIQNKSRYLEESNRLLKQDIARQTSLTKFMSQAGTLGFQSGLTYLRLPTVQPVALNGSSQL